MMADQNAKYWLTTNDHASARLNLQHLWCQLSCGYLIHPGISVNANAKIADIGTGTGIWPISVSNDFPSTIIDGFDITNAQFPPKEWLPANVSLEIWNVHDPVPESLVARYDIVNIRYFALMIKDQNFSTVLKHLITLLKPGGYLQWIEVNIPAQRVVSSRCSGTSDATSTFSESGKKAIAALGVNFDWLEKLPSIFQSFGLIGVKQFKPDPIPALRPMSSYLAIGGWEEFSYAVLDTGGPHPVLGSGHDLRQKLHEVRKEVQTGIAIEQLHYVTVGQRT